MSHVYVNIHRKPDDTYWRHPTPRVKLLVSLVLAFTLLARMEVVIACPLMDQPGQTECCCDNFAMMVCQHHDDGSDKQPNASDSYCKTIIQPDISKDISSSAGVERRYLPLNDINPPAFLLSVFITQSSQFNNPIITTPSIIYLSGNGQKTYLLTQRFRE